MANKKGLGVSRKYAVGSIHENGTGQFVILERFIEEGETMAKVQWQTGYKAGEFDTNKLVNFNSSIHRFQMNRKANAMDAISAPKYTVSIPRGFYSKNETIFEEIKCERYRQNILHPDFPAKLRLSILMEELGEVATALQNEDYNNLIEELIQVASVAIRWIENLREDSNEIN